MLPCVCSVIDHRGRQNVVKTKMCANHTKRVRTEKNNSATQDVRRSSAHWFILIKIFKHFWFNYIFRDVIHVSVL